MLQIMSRLLPVLMFAYVTHCSTLGWADIVPHTLFLTWQQNPQTTMTVQWLSSADKEPLKDLVDYQEVDSNLCTITLGTQFPLTENSAYILHRVELTHLKPDTLYQFQVSNHEGSFYFRT